VKRENDLKTHNTYDEEHFSNPAAYDNKALPVRSLYANEDGCLHLNEAGQYELRINDM
jgi:hypothetical protein